MNSKSHSVLFVSACLLSGVVQAQVPMVQSQDRSLSLSDALQLSLQQSPNILLSKQQVESARGDAMQALGGFDTLAIFSTSRTRNRNPLTPSENAQLSSAGFDDIPYHDAAQSTTRLAVQKPLQNGVVLGVDYTVQRNDDALQALQPGPVGQSQSTGRLNFSLQVPLLRNAGRDVTGATVSASNRQLDATLANLEFANSQSVLSVTLAYWDFVGKQRLFELALESDGRSKRLLGEMRKLADADQIPQSDLELVAASSAEKAAYLVSAEQSMIASRKALARLMGLTTVDELQIERASTPFPAADKAALDVVKTISSRISAAEKQRADLRAAELREQTAQILRVAAEHNIKPQANINMNISNGGMAIGAPSSSLWAPYNNGRTGPTFMVGLEMQLPIENQQAKGLLMARSASLLEAEISRRDLQASISSSIQLAARSLNASVVQFESATIAVSHYAKALANEQTKRRLGAGTLIDVINIEDRYNNAQQTEVQVRQAYAAGIAQLLFETGKIVRKRGDNDFSIPIDALLRYTAETTEVSEQ